MAMFVSIATLYILTIQRQWHANDNQKQVIVKCEVTWQQCGLCADSEFSLMSIRIGLLFGSKLET